LKDELEAQRAAWNEYQSVMGMEEEGRAEPVPGESQAIASVLDAVNLATKKFPGTFVFLDSAMTLAKKSNFQSPELVYGLFEALHELVQKRHSGEPIGKGWKEAMKEKGFTYKPDISPTSKQKKFISDYEFLYGGKKQVFGEHVTFGKGQDPQLCMSVHWLWDSKKKLIVVGRCGKHGANTKT